MGRVSKFMEQRAGEGKSEMKLLKAHEPLPASPKPIPGPESFKRLAEFEPLAAALLTVAIPLFDYKHRTVAANPTRSRGISLRHGDISKREPLRAKGGRGVEVVIESLRTLRVQRPISYDLCTGKP